VIWCVSDTGVDVLLLMGILTGMIKETSRVLSFHGPTLISLSPRRMCTAWKNLTLSKRTPATVSTEPVRTSLNTTIPLFISPCKYKNT